MDDVPDIHDFDSKEGLEEALSNGFTPPFK